MALIQLLRSMFHSFSRKVPARTTRIRAGPGDDVHQQLSASLSYAPNPPAMSSFVHSNLYDLSGRIALVTGGGTGIGLSIARGLGAAGAKVYIGGRRKEVLDKIVNSWDTQHHGQAVALVVFPQTASYPCQMVYGRP
jgi:hypothetical protein